MPHDVTNTMSTNQFFPRIRLRASEVAIACGFHPFDSVNHAFLMDVAIRSGLAKRDDKAKHIGKPFVTFSMATKALQQDEKAKNVENTDLMNTNKTKLSSQQRNMYLGIVKEAENLDEYAQKSGTTIYRARGIHDLKFSAYFPYVPSLLITGRCDAIDVAGNIIESKYRPHGFKDNAPLHERIQLEIYMWLARTTTSKLVQHHQNQYRETTYHPNPMLWHIISVRLHEFVQFFQKFLSDLHSNNMNDNNMNATDSNVSAIYAPPLFFSSKPTPEADNKPNHWIQPQVLLVDPPHPNTSTKPPHSNTSSTPLPTTSNQTDFNTNTNASISTTYEIPSNTSHTSQHPHFCESEINS